MEWARGQGGQGQTMLGLVGLDEEAGLSSKCSAEPPEGQHDPVRHTSNRRLLCARHCCRLLAPISE